MRYFSPCLVAPVFMMGLVLATPRGISRGGLLQIGEESQMDVGFQRDFDTGDFRFTFGYCRNLWQAETAKDNFKTTPMMNAHRFPKALVLLGLASALAGWTFKLNHLMGAPTLFNCGIGLLTIGLIWWAVLLFRGSE